MEIERKFLVPRLPEDLDSYPHHEIMQAYVSTHPVIRIRRWDDQYILTIKSKGLLAHEEIEMPLTEESFAHLYGKIDGVAISKTRYQIPDGKGHTIELDIFHQDYQGFVMAEVEFGSVEEAENYQKPAWFGKDVTMDKRFHNSNLSSASKEEIQQFLAFAKSL